MSIDKKWSPYLFAAIMAFAMGFFMSLILTWVNTGIDEGFLNRWIKAFGVGICIAFPVSILVAPVANKTVNKLTKPD